MKTPRSPLWLLLKATLSLALTLWVMPRLSTLVAQEITPQKAQQTEASRTRLPREESFARKLANAALDRTLQIVNYDPAYVKLAYPGGDVPAETGVCTDEIIRAYRTLGTDLQKLVHEDMVANFSLYPKQWGLSTTDKNIDHRRVPNLAVFFKRHGESLKVTQNPQDYRVGDIITCTVPLNRPHICIVVPSPDGSERPWVVHNIGQGPQLEDRLFEFPLTGHYRYQGKR